jgi:Lysophospholipase
MVQRCIAAISIPGSIDLPRALSIPLGMDKTAQPCIPFNDSLAGVDGSALALTRHPGPRVPVLLAHGFGQTRHSWAATARQLAAHGFSSLAYDARGHGQSPWNPAGQPYHPQQFVDDLIAVSGQLSPTPVLVAASMGGLFGLMAQARWPGLFSAMVLVDITPRWETKGVERILAFMQAHPEGFDVSGMPPMRSPVTSRIAHARANRHCATCCARAKMAACTGIGIHACSVSSARAPRPTSKPLPKRPAVSIARCC